jgi:DNA modification methylase
LARHLWAGYVREAGEKREPHPTQKPVSLMVDAIELMKGDVYDPFLGSGTTLIACEQLNRKCYAVEISEAYVAVCLERWANLTGQQPELIEQAEAADA